LIQSVSMTKIDTDKEKKIERERESASERESLCVRESERARERMHLGGCVEFDTRERSDLAE